jgi:hypothetical protein
MVHRRQLRPISTRGPHELPLCSRSPSASIARCRRFRGGWPRPRPAASAVIADAVHRSRILDHRLAIHIVNDRCVHIIHRAVVVKGSVTPIPSRVADPQIAEPVVDATVESDLRTPVAFIPHIHAIAPAPIARSPQSSDERRQYPCARHPIITVVAICPVAWRPDISFARTDGLRVDGQQRRSDGDRHRDRSERCGGDGDHHHYQQHQSNSARHVFDPSLGKTLSEKDVLQ